ncbi:hypothetical protein FQN49_005458 [Arthroderma sp. PD_2]|nr:hypothetical protein FQN49_005458 [Arthroderma sp. PD_2]
MSAAQPDFPAISRYITTHDHNGKAVFSTQVPESLPQRIVDGCNFGLAYTSSEFPAQLSADVDIKNYEADLINPPGFVISTGTVCQFVDLPPASGSPMHRTVSLDYGVVLEGEVELSLDSGETRIMKRGDIAVQRATNHAWKNVTAGGGWARMLFVLTPSQPVQLAGVGVPGDTV